MAEYLSRRNTVQAALDADKREFNKLWIQEDLSRSSIDAIVRMALEKNIPITYTSKQKIGGLAQDSRHQGVLLEVGPYQYAELDDIFTVAAKRVEKPLILILDLLHGPQNIGSLLRTAEICGAHGVIVQDRRAPDITPTVSQYSAGSAEYLNVCQVTNLAQAIMILQENEVWVIGLDIDEEARLFGSVDLDLPIALVVGHEGSGLRRVIKKHCDFLIKLPMRGHTESLNAAVAGSIVLYAAWQARDLPEQ